MIRCMLGRASLSSRDVVDFARYRNIEDEGYMFPECWGAEDFKAL